MALAIETDANGLWKVQDDWNPELPLRCCDVGGCTNTEPWHRIRKAGNGKDEVWLCDEHFEECDA